MLRARWLALVAACVLGGCAAESTRFEVVFADGALRDASAAVELTLRAGDCATGELLWRRVVGRDEQPSELPPPLRRGRAYCVEAIARDTTCAVVASARLESADAPVGLVTLTLAAPAAGAPGCEGTTCVDGECLERCDVDGAACFSSGASGVCRAGACCTGCWDGESCLPGTPAAELSTGETFTCMRTGDGRVACWGSNGQGELGDGTRGGTTSASWRADARTLDVPEGTIFSSVVAGVASGYAIDTAGGLWAWGWNARGQLGLGELAVGVSALSPVQVPHPLGNAWDRVAAPHTHDDAADPDLHACAFSRGELWCWGANEEGQVDPRQRPTARDAIVASPRRIEGLFSDVAITQRATCAILTDGMGVSCWGDNTRGTLGTGDAEPRTGIVVVPLPEDAGRIVEIAGGVAGFCVRSDAGRVFCWGDAAAASLPLAAGTIVRAVEEAPALSAAVAASTEDERLAIGREHGGALTGSAPWVWGSNVDGRLALGAAALGSTLPPGPTAEYPGAPAIARELRVGSYHTCVRLDDGTLACAGANDLGQLGVPMTRPDEPDWQRYCPCVDCEL